MTHLPHVFWIFAFFIVAIAGCGGDDDDSTGGTVGDDDGGSSVDDDSDDDDNSGPCDVDPICQSFHNDGSQGGQVDVSISDDGEYAVITTNSLAEHEMGPFTEGPTDVIAQDFEFLIPLDPAPGNNTETPLGPMAVAYNGVALFNPWDSTSVDDCRANALFFRADSFDSYGGHPQQEGNYHYHVGTFLNSAEELDLANSPDEHSPILGYSFDGFPIYGPYGYSSAEDASSDIKLLTSCYSLKDVRDCCTDDASCGVDAIYLNKTASMGAWIEDYAHDNAAYEAGTCDLNEYNMRYQVTPEYPEGVWAYVMTMEDETPIYPYIIGMTYYGEPSESGVNAGPPGGGPPASPAMYGPQFGL